MGLGGTHSANAGPAVLLFFVGRRAGGRGAGKAKGAPAAREAELKPQG